MCDENRGQAASVCKAMYSTIWWGRGGGEGEGRKRDRNLLYRVNLKMTDNLRDKSFNA